MVGKPGNYSVWGAPDVADNNLSDEEVGTGNVPLDIVSVMTD